MLPDFELGENSLGSILSQKGELIAALRLNAGYPISNIARYLSDRFANVSMATVNQVINFGRQMLGAGSYLTGLNPSESINIGNIPVNPYLFGDEPGGARGLVSTIFSATGDSPFGRHDIIVPDFGTIDQIIGDIRDFLFNVAPKYPRLQRLLNEESPEYAAIFIVAAERRF